MSIQTDKKLCLSIVCGFVTFLVHSQDTISPEYKRDTLQGRHFGQFIKPANGFNLIKSEDIESPYFKKCVPFKSEDEKRKCFSNIFYENLRKKIRISRATNEQDNISLIVKFTINKAGGIEAISFPKSNDRNGSFEKEVIRVLKKMPEIIPAKKDGEFVSSTYSFPLSFNN